MMIFICGVGLYLLVMLVMGYYASKKVNTLQDYLVAGRKLPFYLAMPTIVATWYGAGSCMGVSGTVYSQGFYGVIADPFACSIALIIAGIFFVVPFRKLQLLTISDLLGKVYGSKFEIVATLLMIPFYVGTLAAQMIAMGYIFHVVSGSSPEIGMLVGSLIVVVYTISGGMWAVSVTDFLQLILVIVGLSFLVPICFEKVQDHQILLHKFSLEFLNLYPSGKEEVNWLAYFGRLLMTGLGAIMGQDLIQRALASNSTTVARSSAIVAGFVYFLLGLIPLFIGVAGREIFPDLTSHELLIPMLAKEYLTPVAFTIFACGLFSAIMSTADSYLLACASLVTNNLILPLIDVKGEKQKIAIVRIVNIFVILLALIIAFTGPSIFDMMVHSGATLFVAIFVPVCFALFSKNPNKVAALCAMLFGLASWIGFILYSFATSTEAHEEILFAAATIGGLCSLTSYLVVHYATTRAKAFSPVKI